MCLEMLAAGTWTDCRPTECDTRQTTNGFFVCVLASGHSFFFFFFFVVVVLKVGGPLISLNYSAFSATH